MGSWPSSVKGANVAEGDAGLRCLHVAFPGLAGAEAMCSTRLPSGPTLGSANWSPGGFPGLGAGGWHLIQEGPSRSLGEKTKKTR